MKKGFTLVELTIAMTLSILILLVILLSTISINKASLGLYKKYDISMKSKLLLSRIARDLLKNQSPTTNQNPIISLNDNTIVFYSVRIQQQSIIPTIVSLTINNNRINNGYRYEVLYNERDLQNYTLDNKIYTFFIEADNSTLFFRNLNNVAIRIYLLNSFRIRDKRYELNYKLDIPVNP